MQRCHSIRRLQATTRDKQPQVERLRELPLGQVRFNQVQWLHNVSIGDAGGSGNSNSRNKMEPVGRDRGVWAAGV
jgi:hypothetical protein